MTSCFARTLSSSPLPVLCFHFIFTTLDFFQVYTNVWLLRIFKDKNCQYQVLWNLKKLLIFWGGNRWNHLMAEFSLKSNFRRYYNLLGFESKSGNGKNKLWGILWWPVPKQDWWIIGILVFTMLFSLHWELLTRIDYLINSMWWTK